MRGCPNDFGTNSWQILHRFVLINYKQQSMKFYIYTHNGAWHVECFIEAFCVEEVANALVRAGATREVESECLANFHSGSKNGGFTFSNSESRSSVMCTFNSESLPQLMSTILHEAKRLERHISKADGTEPYGKRAGYLAGEIIQRAVETTV